MSASNGYGVTSPSLALDMTKTYHGVSITLPNGGIIGRIQDFNPTFASRSIVPLYELNRQTVGRPIDNIPGIESGRSISITRVEVWDDELEIALAAAEREWIDLCEQTKPFSIIESMFRGNSKYRAWSYDGCWFASKSLDSFSAEGDMKVSASAEINYVIRRSI
ncbi:hypothetical protein KFS98_003658 [Salmonella enterica]|uniref:hypothetical protein n=1 Tax=Yersinia ruckeri TaxID=29486 RepID=UPI00223790E2|nr:hypothetical protein [Yersinia ruckeri]EHM1384171.1 hypothetical protein [Salmonella enterica]MCW6598869.1 hypothetical protein [Yersinia ruckeri]